MLSFSDVWADVRDFLAVNRVIRVCGVGDFTVIECSDEGFFVMSRESSEPEFIKKEWVQEAWNILQTRKSIASDELLRERGWGLWASLILSLLSYQPYVRCFWDKNQMKFIYRI